MADTPNQAGFDVQGARQAGYSDDEILQHLTQSRGFDVQGALSAGYSKQDIIDHLSTTQAPSASQGPIPAGQPNAAGGPSSVQMQEVQPGVSGLVKDQAKAVAAHPGQAALGAAGEAINLARSVMPSSDMIDPKTGKSWSPPPADPNSIAGKIQNLIGNKMSQPKTPAGGAGQTATDVAATAANVPAAVKSVGSAIRSVKNWMDVPGAISKDAVGVLQDVSRKEGLPAITSDTARDATAELSRNFVGRAKAQYKTVDDAVDGDLGPVLDDVRDLKTKIARNVDPEVGDKLTDQLKEKQALLGQLVERAKINGVQDADKIIASADQDYARGMAMRKVSDGVKTASGVVKMNGDPHPGGFASQIDRLYNKGVLQRALGDEGSQAMQQTARAGLDQAQKVAAAKKVAGRTAAAAGLGAVSAGSYELYKTLRGH